MVKDVRFDYKTQMTKELLLIRDGWKCSYCGYPFAVSMDGWNNMALDHIDPNKGDEIDNLTISCKNCNSAKAATVFDGDQLHSFRERRGLIRARDEGWVLGRFAFVSKHRDSTNAADKAYFETLCSRLSSGEYVQDMQRKLSQELELRDQPVQSVYDGGVYLSFTVDGYEWTYTLATFALQPHFIYKCDQSGTTIDERLNGILESLGYLKDNCYRSKLLEPFSDLDDGIATIKAEILLVHAIWSLNS